MRNKKKEKEEGGKGVDEVVFLKVSNCSVLPAITHNIPRASCVLDTRAAITMGAMATSILPRCRASTQRSHTTRPSQDRCTTPRTTGAPRR